MSVRAMAWAWEQELPEGEKLLLMAVADHADDSGICWPGQENLGKKIGRSERTVRRRLTKLEMLGLIARKPRYNADGNRTSDQIILSITTGQLDRRSTLPPVKAVSGEPSGVLPTTHGSTSSGNGTTPRISTTGARKAKTGHKGKGGDNDRPSVKVDRLVVTDEEWDASTRILAAFNEAVGTKFQLLGTRGRPTDHLRRIISRLREHPEVSLDQHLEVVRWNCENPWWSGKPASVAVIYGPGAFPRCLAMGEGPLGKKRFADERRSDDGEVPW